MCRKQVIRPGTIITLCMAATLLWIAAQPGRTSEDIQGEFFAYTNGKLSSWHLATLKAQQQQIAEGGHMPWRQDPADVASIDAFDLLPKEAAQDEASGTLSRGFGIGPQYKGRKWQAAYNLVDKVGDTAHVDLRINGRREFTFTLVRPFNYWWFIVDVIPQSPRAQARLAEKPAGKMVALRNALEKHGFQVNWKPEANAVSVQHGLLQRSLSLKGCVADGKRRDGVCRMRNVDGRILVPHALIAGLLAEDLMESLRSSGSAGS